MAELLIGEHCSIEDCKLLDFLPCLCNGCGKIFCKNHLCYESHNCSRNDLLENKEMFEGEKSFPCSVENCKQRELTPIKCEHCEENFCLRHRHQTDHACSALVAPKERLSETAKHVQEVLAQSHERQAANKSPKKLTSEKSRALAAKVALMKIKQKATGEIRIPNDDRVYFEVTLPQNHPTLTGEKSSKSVQCPVLVDRNWAVGRAIDYIANSKNITNNNNKAGAAKLRMFEAATGHLCPSSKTFIELMSEEKSACDTECDVKLFNGNSLTLEYVNDDVTKLHY